MTKTEHTRKFQNPLSLTEKTVVATITRDGDAESFIVRMGVPAGECLSGFAYLLRTDDRDEARRHFARLDAMIRESGFEKVADATRSDIPLLPSDADESPCCRTWFSHVRDLAGKGEQVIRCVECDARYRFPLVEMKPCGECASERDPATGRCGPCERQQREKTSLYG